MDFHAAMETFAEAWVAANTQTAVNTHDQAQRPSTMEEAPSQVQKEPKLQKACHQPPGQEKVVPSNSGVKSLPIHCVIEQTSGPLTFDPESSSTSSVELDSYAILPSTTLISELVRSALIKLGYNANEAMNAKGAIQIKNWKPLSFETITEDCKATVEDILGELTQVAKLRIRLSSSPSFVAPENWTDHTVRCAVMVLLKEMSQSTLAKHCPLTQSVISNIANWKYPNKLSAEKCQEFGEWYKQFTAQKEFCSEGSRVPKDSRMTFHPQYEIPIMRQWYNSCKTPSDDKLKFFTAELNKGHVRQERPNITVAKLKIWWKNERQREKRMTNSSSCEVETTGIDTVVETTGSDTLASQQEPSASTSRAEYLTDLSNISSNVIADELLCRNTYPSNEIPDLQELP